MMLLTSPPLHTHIYPSNLNSITSTTNSSVALAGNLLLCSAANSHKLPTAAGTTASSLRTTTLPSSPFSFTSTSSPASNLHCVTQSPYPDDRPEPEEEEAMLPSASAIVSAIRRGSTSAVEFEQRIEKDQKSKSLLPSPDFHRLCVEQLDLFRRIVHPESVLSVYVRPAGSYVMDQLELRRVASVPRTDSDDEIVVLIGNFRVATGLRAAEAALTRRQIECVSEPSAVVFPMVKHPFVVGFLVAELPKMEMEVTSDVQGERKDLLHLPSLEKAYQASSGLDEPWLRSDDDNEDELHSSSHKFLPADQRLNAINISRSLAMAYVMDQKAMLLQHSSWQNNVRMSSLVEQIRGSLSSIRTLSKMLTVHVKKTEIPYDIVEDILAQGDNMRNTLQELQDAVHMTKARIVSVSLFLRANIMRYNEESLKRISTSTNTSPERASSQLPQNLLRDKGSKLQNSGDPLQFSDNDLEMPMPPFSLAPLDTVGIRPCIVSEVLSDMVEAVKPLAHMQQRIVELADLSPSLQVAVEEPALRQALSNLIEGALLRTQAGGRVEIVSTGAPGGGVLVMIDDDGPDMHYMTQMHSLTPFGAELFSDDMVEDNMTWNFIAGLSVAREILEVYGCVVRVISPRSTDAVLGSGGTRVELWLPSLSENPN
ncbi:unnamed protein product [Linum tenue]|uniref:Histidine kinase/HSP90-like ATPase domain-containing protein n=1 Tax=Linum tenue TaxID=586396 RepID=A0AAV0HYC6_9ROSI|nr:unnamed protein product [Linum tenue]CAI0462429.1 unnamed protein product [Linum tenue]